MPYMPLIAHVAVAGSDANVSAQPWNHGLALSWSSSMAISQRMLSHNLIDLSDCMLKDSLERESELDGIRMIYVVASTRWEASLARNHKPEVRVLINRGSAEFVIRRSPMLALSDERTDMGTRKIPVERHTFSSNVIVQHSNNEAITKVACQSGLTVIEWAPCIGWIVICRLAWVTRIAFVRPWTIHGRRRAWATMIVEVNNVGSARSVLIRNAALPL